MLTIKLRQSQPPPSRCPNRRRSSWSMDARDKPRAPRGEAPRSTPTEFRHRASSLSAILAMSAFLAGPPRKNSRPFQKSRNCRFNPAVANLVRRTKPVRRGEIKLVDRLPNLAGDCRSKDCSRAVQAVQNIIKSLILCALFQKFQLRGSILPQMKIRPWLHPLQQSLVR